MQGDLKSALQPILEEILKNGPTEGLKIWCDPAHPLTIKVTEILRDHCLDEKQKAALLEEYSRFEKAKASYGL